MATYSVFNKGPFTGQQMENNGDPIIFGNAFELTDDLPTWVCTGGRFYLDSSFVGELELPVQMQMWLTADFSGTPAASGQANINWGNWVDVIWPTPVDLPGANVPFYITMHSTGSTSNRLVYKASPGSGSIVSPDTSNLEMLSVAAGRSWFRSGTGSTQQNSGGVLFSVDAIVSDGAPDKQPISFTATRMSGSQVLVAWTVPSDAPLGVSVIRAEGVHSDDGNGNAPGSPGYDPTTLAGAQVIHESDTDGSYTDNGLSGASEYTYWLIRTGAGA